MVSVRVSAKVGLRQRVSEFTIVGGRLQEVVVDRFPPKTLTHSNPLSSGWSGVGHGEPILVITIVGKV